MGRSWAILLTSIRKVCKFVHFGNGEKVSNFAHFNQESVQICSLWWWGGEQFCSLQSGKCANFFTFIMGRRWAILLTSIRKVCKFVHFYNGEEVINFDHFNQESVQICSLYWWGEVEQFCSLLSGKCANLFTLLVGRSWAILLTSYQESVQICSLYWWGEGEQFCSLHSGKCANLFTLLMGRTSIRKVYKFVDFTDGEKLSNFAH